jgi:hypothetical protein
VRRPFPGPPRGLLRHSTRAASLIAVLLVLAPDLKLLDDLSFSPRAFASVSISNWLELLVSASHLPNAR